MRRHPDYSVQMAALFAGMRVMAMTLGPKVLVNALGVGVIGDPPIAGDPAMLSHASLGRAGTVQEIVDTVLFFCDPLNSYTTGQLLSVDGGWSAGYGRNF
jgi:NAD(P)-dependent dehydrogenase (short-subunit alcohol dehydrogenase family)